MAEAKMNTSSVQEVILHCQKQIKKNTGEEKLLHYIGRLRRLRIKVKDLVDTGIGRTVNQLSRLEGKVGHEALDLVAEWKALVEAEEKEKSSSEASESSSHDEEEEEELDDDQEDEGALRIIDHQEVDDADAEAEVEVNNHDSEASLPRLAHSRSRSPPLVSSHSNCMSEESDDDEVDNGSGHSSGEDENRVVPYIKSEPSSPVRVRNISPTMKKHSYPNGDVVNEVEQKSHHRNRDLKHEKLDTETKHKVKSHSYANGDLINEVEQKSHHRNRDRKHEKSDTEAKHKVKSPPSHSHKSSHRKTDRHSHSRGEGSSKHRHKDDRSSSKRKNDEELLKPETEVKKVKTEPKLEKQKNPRQLVPTLSVEIDSTSGVNFADVLSCMDKKVSSSSSKKKDKPKTNGSSSKSSKASGSDPSVSHKSKRTAHEDKRNVNKNGVGSKEKEREKEIRAPKPKSVILPTFSLTAASTALISPNYKPSAVARIMAVAPMPVPKASTSVPPREILNSLRQDYHGVSGYPAQEGENRLDYDRRTTEDALSTMIASRNQRTKVYSGVKSGFIGAMPKLFDLCIRVIQENINDLGYTGGVPFDILKPVLHKATADQLLHVENYNPYLIEYTDEMWKFHCGKDFRGKEPQELESWRELYTRLVDERKARFHTLTNKVKRTQETATPQMKAKLAYVDTTSGPRFHKSKAETIKNGMKTLKTREEKGIKRTHGSSASAGGSGSSQNVTIEEASVIISAKSRAGSAPASASREPRESTAAKKPKKAPLMQKTLKVIKTLFRR